MTFEQLQELLAQTIEITNRNATVIAEIGENKAITNSNARTVEAMLQQMTMDREERNAVIKLIARQQKQLDRHQRILKGLQTENRRILDLLINNQPEPNDED